MDGSGYGGVEWHWYHCGDGNHFASIYKPDDLRYCYDDPTWKELCEGRLEAYEAEGYKIATVSELLRALASAKREELPHPIEGGWNPDRSSGLLGWMRRHASQWEDDCAVLIGIARARSRLVVAERVGEGGDYGEELRATLEAGWTAVLNAEISDPWDGFLARRRSRSHYLRPAGPWPPAIRLWTN